MQARFEAVVVVVLTIALGGCAFSGGGGQAISTGAPTAARYVVSVTDAELAFMQTWNARRDAERDRDRAAGRVGAQQLAALDAAIDAAKAREAGVVALVNAWRASGSRPAAWQVEQTAYVRAVNAATRLAKRTHRPAPNFCAKGTKYHADGWCPGMWEGLRAFFQRSTPKQEKPR